MNIARKTNYGITDIPDEILIEIILHLNVRERVCLGDTCKRFYTLVFEDKTLLRDLDFSREWRLASQSDIRKYFCNENRNKHVLKVNFQNVSCIGWNRLLNDYISKAVNLVDINIHGIPLIPNILALGSFLKSLIHVKRLSLDWPMHTETYSGHLCDILKERFSKLSYMSVRMRNDGYLQGFYYFLQSCQELRELHLKVRTHQALPHGAPFGIELESLEIVEYYGPHDRQIEEYFVSNILPHPEEWTHFQLADSLTCMTGFYLERNVEVCNEMLEAKSLKKFTYNYPKFASKLDGFVISACLLKEVMRISGEIPPIELCCFSPSQDGDEGQMCLPTVFHGSKMWMLKISEAKRLLKYPRHQISYLNIFHKIEHECDAHIVASAFQNITELVLSNLTTRKTPKKTVQPNTHSSFHELVKGTPHMRHVSIVADLSELEIGETWDLPALHSIAGWRSLTTLRLWNVPIIDGKFMIEIGKQCKHLEKLELSNLGSTSDVAACYKNELLRMLIHCNNLKDFALRQRNMGQLFDIFSFLSHNLQLERVCIKNDCHEKAAGINLERSMKELLCRCSKLTTFVYLNYGTSRAELDNLRSILQNLKTQLNRSSFQFQVGHSGDLENIVYEDTFLPLCLQF